MKCPKCKNEVVNDSKFCDQCGYSFKGKKFKLVIIITLVLAVIGFSIGLSFSYFLSPTYVANKYFKAVISNDANNVYKYVKSDSPFVTKESFLKKYETVGNVTDYKIESMERENNYIKVNYTYKLDGNAANSYVKLNEKKFLGIFTYYKVETGSIARNVELRVLKGSKVSIDSTDMTKYLKNSEEYFDVYVLPDLISGEYSVEVDMPIGISVTKNISFTDSSKYTIAKIKLENDLKDKLSDDLIDKLNVLYKAGVEGKKYKEISDNFYNDLSSLYRSIKRSLGSNITSFNFTDISISSSSLDDEGKLSLEVIADYDVRVNDEDKSDYLSFKVTYSYDDNEFNLYDIDNSYQVKTENYQ